MARATSPLHQISATVYHTEHCLFIIDSSIPWSSSSAAYAAIYSPSGGTFPYLATYFDTLTTQFPGTYFSVCYMANTGASNVPNYIDRTFKASGINEPGTQGAAQSFTTVDICRYNLQGNLFTPMLAVFDHELGHAWGAQAFNTVSGPALSNGHWLSNSTVDCQLSATYSADGGATVNKLYGDSVNGFRWQKVDNLRSNDYSTFSEQELYLMGVAAQFPTSYVLNGVSYNADGTASYSSLDTFDHSLMISRYGARSPDYTSSQKRFKLGFVYIARDLAEVNSVYAVVEQSINQFCNGETIDTHSYRFQVPFVADARYRASVDGLLGDLDGNSTPSISVSNAYATSSDGSATINFTASDPDGTTPSVSLVQGSNCATVVGNSVQLANLPDGVFFFTLKAQDSGGKKAFAHFVVEVQRAAGGPSITTQPKTKTVTAGNTATFTVAASGSPTSYQWYRQPVRTSTWDRLSDGGAYSGSATATLSVATDVAMNEDHFLCVVSDASGATTSTSAELRADETTPVFTSQPSDAATSAGTSTPFSVAVGGSTNFGYFTYQWQIQAAGTSTWADLANGGAYSGVTTNALRVVSAASMNGDKFRCKVTNTAGTATSNIATLSSGTAPAITLQPASVSVSAGQNASFTVIASGTAPLTYQWYVYSTPVSGGTSATLNLTNVQASNAGAYTVRVTNAFGFAVSNVGSLTVSSSAPSITLQPQSATATVGQSVSLSVSAVGSNPLSYQWRKGGTPITGATSATLTFNTVGLADTGNYDVVVSNLVNSVTSSSANLSVNSLLQFTLQPLGSTVIAGSSATFSVTATGSPAPTFQWYKNGVAIPGATSSNYSIVGATTGDQGIYTAIASNAAGSTTSNNAPLTVNPLIIAPSITAQPISTGVNSGAAVSISVSVSGTGPFTYVWRKNGVPIGGAVGSTFSISNAQSADTGKYTVTITNSAGSVTSVTATLTVSVPRVPQSDFNHDGIPDIAWYNTLYGGVYIGLLSNLGSSGYQYVSAAPLGWELVGIGDFDSNGTPDLVWRIPATGDVYVWYMSGTSLLSSQLLCNLPSPWKVCGVQDFDHDGNPDLLWRHPLYGGVYIGYIASGKTKSYQYVCSLSSEWELQAVADFNSDGSPDLVWRNSITGSNYVCLMSGAQPVQYQYISSVDLSWTILGACDINNDGAPDILWYNTTTGAVYGCLMTGTSVTAYYHLTTVSGPWSGRTN